MRLIRATSRAPQPAFRRFLTVAFCASSFAPTSLSFSTLPSARNLETASNTILGISTPVQRALRPFRPTSTSSPMSSKSVSTSTTSSAPSKEKLCLGGDFAGYVGKFAPSDGTLIPIPIYLVPEDLREWGQEPSSLEILVSEETDSGSSLLERQTITVLPAIGCGVDNLETKKSEETFKTEETVSWSDVTNHPSVGTIDTTASGEAPKKLRLETFFALPEAHRVRVSLDLRMQEDDKSDISYKIQSPVQIQLERQTSTTSTKGTRADGGGLDGRTVSTLIGDQLRPQLSFAEKGAVTQGTSWKASSSSEMSEVVHFPGNITIGSGSGDDGWALEVSHFSSSNDSDNELEGSRRTVHRVFQGFESTTTTVTEEVGEYVVA